ncbi:NicO-domain-containing protein [Coprinellus micaceus]|uniref:Nickel/cobalt efflux system n=1 Tax=Coprinellus micaceus TaxID=71717 RepID=A0A4Y7T5A4_COPMI|nr:NicO-domain-containing protein [Coprinellus micaceus]
MPLRLTLLGRSTLLLTAELLANVLCWVVAAILFAPKPETRSLLSLALLAWIVALDADHISAIDNATRGLINLGQLPVTCGLFFSLGHSTIVVVVTIAIAISSDVFERMNRVGEVGGIVGAAVSGSFLFIVGLANTVILFRVLNQRRRQKQIRGAATDNVPAGDVKDAEGEDNQPHRTLTMRIVGPIITFVNRPWKMYPVGVLFGFGFDTASSIALLAISAIAKRHSDKRTIPSSHVVILPLLFTAGMSFLDSLDSVIMLYSYAGFPQRSWKFFEIVPRAAAPPPPPQEKEHISVEERDANEKVEVGKTVTSVEVAEESDEQYKATMQAKMNVMSGLSVILTVLSILVAFTISLITIMGLIGENCRKCIEAAEAEDGGGLAGRWWRGWAAAGEQSGWIGIGIVGGFIAVVAAWYGGRWAYRRYREPSSAAPAGQNNAQ